MFQVQMGLIKETIIDLVFIWFRVHLATILENRCYVIPEIGAFEPFGSHACLVHLKLLVILILVIVRYYLRGQLGKWVCTQIYLGRLITIKVTFDNRLNLYQAITCTNLDFQPVYLPIIIFMCFLTLHTSYHITLR